MSKYTFQKLGSTRFEHLVQALLEKQCRVEGHLIQFGDGKDGAREATWSQPSTNSSYTRPKNTSTDIDKEWVFQAKFHDTDLRGWDRARADVESDLDKELDKIVNKYQVPCHKYILVTNVPFSGVRYVGTRDKVNEVRRKWQSKIPEIEVWDATDLSRMLDADTDTRTTYLGDILPGDILRELLKSQTRSEEVRVNSLRTYLKSLLRSERDAKAEEAGDEGGLKLEHVFVDLNLSLNQKSTIECALPLIKQIQERESHTFEDGGGESDPFGDGDSDDSVAKHTPNSLDYVPASFALLRANYKSLLIKGGPGVGKSTLTQFLSLYHASRLVDPALASQLAKRLKLSGGVTENSLDAHCEVRFPLRIELRRYAKWISEMQRKEANPHFAAYFAERINRESSSSFDMEDIFALTSNNPVLLLLDGLDEVPQPSTREVIFEELRIFLDRCESEECDINVILSSRPQGYRGEFDGFEPLEWQVVDLSRSDFDDYSNRWLDERIPNVEDRSDARQRVTDGMKSHAVQLMAKTLLQATVMLTIAKRKHAIPHAKHKLYEKFVEVIFEREQNKQPIIRERAEELKRLHEKVGFELICKLEKQDGAQTLEGAEFRACVERVILDYGQQLMNGEHSTKIVDDIVTLSKDRLCLIAGKGENQEDIDFVIQPFREYFAAAYLARHENADPDRAYNALIYRQHIWGNVLQFYAAFQSTSQQRNWISEADGTDQDSGDLEYQIEMTRRRRALIRVLPEFVRPRNEYVIRAFLNLMEHSTRWSWRDRNSTAGLLEAFSQNDTYNNLTTCFKELSVDDEQTLYVELDLLAKTANSVEKDHFQKRMSDLITNGSTISTALKVAQGNDLPVDVKSVDIDFLRENIPRHFWGRNQNPFRLENWKGLSDGEVVDLAVSKRLYNHHDARIKKEWINDLLNILLEHPSKIFEIREIGFLFPTYFYKRDNKKIAVIRNKLKTLSKCTSRPYLIALLDAIEEQSNMSLYAKAKAEESFISENLKLIPHLKVKNQLGPAPSAFESDEMWIASRKSVFNRGSQELSNWTEKLDGNVWLALFVPQAGWPHLEPLLPTEKLTDLNGAVLDRLKLMTGGSANLAKVFRFTHQNRNTSILLVILVNIAAEIGEDFLVDSELKKMLRHSELSLDDDIDVNEFLATVESLSCPSYFCACVVGACLNSKDVDLQRITKFWAKRCLNESIHIGESRYDLMNKLLNISSDEATRLAASLQSGSGQRRSANPSIVIDVVKRYCSILVAKPQITFKDLDVLFSLPAQLSELDLWTRDDTLQVLSNTTWELDIYRDRLMEIVNVSTSHQEHVRHALGVIIQNRIKYSPEIALAAIDAIHRLDEITCSPLEETDWQE